SGTFGMEAVARQFANQQKCLILRNGWFSFRWTQILEIGNIAASTTVLKARTIDSSAQSPYTPAPIKEVIAVIKKEQPAIVFAPHVETSSGIILPDDYLKSVAEAVHSVGGIFVLDCIASGTIWVDMQKVGVDVLISAPQKGWSGSPCCALVMLNELARERIEQTQSTSFACDLKKWLQIMEAYEQGGHAYHATMPTDSLVKFSQVMKETQAYGFGKLKTAQQQLGDKTRALLASKGINSVAAKGFEAPGVVVSYTTDGEVQNGKKFAALGMQIAAGVPLQCDEGDDFRTFRIGLFGLDKLYDVDSAVATFAETLSQVTTD
ncbi:MAG: aspartate aminotransferase-like enzyme, partial [Oceanospirillaceae bacterium]